MKSCGSGTWPDCNSSGDDSYADGEEIDGACFSLRASAGEAPNHHYAKGVVERSRERRVRIANLKRRVGVNLKETRIEDAARVACEKMIDTRA